MSARKQFDNPYIFLSPVGSHEKKSVLLPKTLKSLAETTQRLFHADLPVQFYDNQGEPINRISQLLKGDHILFASKIPVQPVLSSQKSSNKSVDILMRVKTKHIKKTYQKVDDFFADAFSSDSYSDFQPSYEKPQKVEDIQIESLASDSSQLESLFDIEFNSEEFEVNRPPGYLKYKFRSNLGSKFRSRRSLSTPKSKEEFEDFFIRLLNLPEQLGSKYVKNSFTDEKRIKDSFLIAAHDFFSSHKFITFSELTFKVSEISNFVWKLIQNNSLFSKSIFPKIQIQIVGPPQSGKSFFLSFLMRDLFHISLYDVFWKNTLFVGFNGILFSNLESNEFYNVFFNSLFDSFFFQNQILIKHKKEINNFFSSLPLSKEPPVFRRNSSFYQSEKYLADGLEMIVSGFYSLWKENPEVLFQIPARLAELAGYQRVFFFVDNYEFFGEFSLFLQAELEKGQFIIVNQENNRPFGQIVNVVDILDQIDDTKELVVKFEDEVVYKIPKTFCSGSPGFQKKWDDLIDYDKGDVIGFKKSVQKFVRLILDCPKKITECFFEDKKKTTLL